MARPLEVIILAKDQASAAFKKIGASVGSMSKAAEAAILPFGAMSAAGTALIAKTTMMAIEQEQLGLTFGSLAESIGTTSEALLSELRPAAMGTLSDIELMQAANKLMAMGLADTTDKASELTEMAVTLGAAMGVDATTALENFTLMLANQSIPRLDTFGISSGKVRERIKELMETTEGMTREQAFMTATMEQARIAIGKVGDVSDTTAIKVGQIQANIANLSTELGEQFLPYASEALGVLTDLTDQLLGVDEATMENVATLIAYATAMSGAVAAASSLVVMGPKILTLMTTLAVPPAGLFILAAAALGAIAVAAVKSHVELQQFRRELMETEDTLEGYLDKLEEEVWRSEELISGKGRLVEETHRLQQAQWRQAEAMAWQLEKFEAVDEALRREQDEYGKTAFAVTEFSEAVTQAATEAELSMKFALGRTILDLRENMDAYEELKNTVTTVYADTGGIIEGFNQDVETMQTNLNERLVALEHEREEKLAWVRAGAHARTHEENEEALAYWNRHYDQEAQKLRDAVNEKIGIREEEKNEDIRVAQETAAERSRIAEEQRQEEMARLREAQQERIILFGLEMLSYKDQLEIPIEGFEEMDVSAQEFFDLVKAGIIPVGDELEDNLAVAFIELKGTMEESGQAGEESYNELRRVLDSTVGDVMDIGEETDNLERTHRRANREMREQTRRSIRRMKEYRNSITDTIEAWNKLNKLTGGGAPGPGLQAGLAYVPFSPYPAMLHEGEAVLTARQAAQWRAGQGRTWNIHVYTGDVHGMEGAAELVEDMIREAGRYAI